MTSRIFSINLDDVTFAKLGELKKKYPDMSRNGMIRHIIHVVHSGEVEDYSKDRKHLVDIIETKIKQCKKLEYDLERYKAVAGDLGWMKEKKHN